MKTTSLTCVIALALGSMAPTAWAQEEVDPLAAELARMRQQLEALKRQSYLQEQTIEVLETRLERYENQTAEQGRFAADAAPAAAETEEERVAVAAPGERQRPAHSESAEAVYREQNALFSQRLTIEPGLTYTYSDRNDLTLNGFYALDAIFLGNLSVDRVKSNTLQLDLTTRYGITDRLRLDLNVPFLYRYSQYASVGEGGSGGNSVDDTVSTGPDLGDVSASLYYELAKETESRPNIVWNVGVTAPTGIDPFGIETTTLDTPGSGENLTVPDELPTGNGLWAASTGFSFVKTTDPAILFANLGYRHYFDEHFDDIDAAGGDQPGRVQLGDAFSWGIGTAFALNPRMSVSLSYAQTLSQKAEVKADGGDWSDVVGSDANAQSLNMGVTYALSEKTTMVTNLGVGLTEDAPDVTLNLRFPYSF